MEKIEEGQGKLADAIKTLIYQRYPELFERLDFNDDTIFLEPFLFAWFNDPSPSQVSIEQILFGYIQDENKLDGILVFSDELGTIYLPNMGYLKTRKVSSAFTLRWDSSIHTLELEHDSERIEFGFEPLYFIPDTQIEVLLYPHPLLKPIFSGSLRSIRDMEDNGRKSGEVEITRIIRSRLPQLEASLRTMSAYSPQMFEQISGVARRIVVFSCSGLWSFATLAAHGTAFMSCTDKDGELFFLAELAHQFGHNVLNAICVEKEKFFKVNPETTFMATYTGNVNDERSIYSAFHGLYTTTKVAEVLDSCYEAGAYSGLLLYELKGRLADNKRRFYTGVEKLPLEEIFTRQGLSLYVEINEQCTSIYRKHAELVQQFNVSNQPFVFSFSQFLKDNPLTPKFKNVQT